MFEFIKKLFNKNKKIKVSKKFNVIENKEKEKCKTCPLKNDCALNKFNFCDIKLPKNYDKNKKTILIIDDNEGIVSFLEDDIKTLFKKYNLNENDFNIVKIGSIDAPLKLKSLLEIYEDFKVDYAIIDLTFGFIIKTQEGNIKLNGVDIFCNMYKKNKNIRFVFFTGNTLNPYIKSNKIMIDKFKDCHGDDIMKYIIYKNQFNEEERINEFYKRLFS